MEQISSHNNIEHSNIYQINVDQSRKIIQLFIIDCLRYFVIWKIDVCLIKSILSLYKNNNQVPNFLFIVILSLVLVDIFKVGLNLVTTNYWSSPMMRKKTWLHDLCHFVVFSGQISFSLAEHHQFNLQFTSTSKGIMIDYLIIV